MPTNWEQEHILDLRKKIRGRDFRIEEFDGTDPMSLLTFLPVLRDTFNEMALTEGIGVRLLSYILKDSAKEVYVTQTTAGYQTASFTPHVTWPFVVNALIRHYLHDDILQTALDKVRNAQQIDGESESTFSQRLQALARSCQGVFTEAELVSHFVKGLRTAIRTRVQNMIRTLPATDRTNIHVVTSLSENEGRSQRAQAEATLKSSRGSGGGGGRAKHVTFFLGDDDRQHEPVHGCHLRHVAAQSSLSA